ncbi:MAG: hypothetical protein ABI901_03370, partial [Roseiflexaceae bacterium]
AYSVWSLLTILASFSLWRSMGRFTAVVFPLFIITALLVKTDRWFQTIVYVRASLKISDSMTANDIPYAPFLSTGSSA